MAKSGSRPALAGPKRVGRSGVPIQKIFAALRAAGRSVGCAESETRNFIFVGRSVDTQSVLLTSLRPADAHARQRHLKVYPLEFWLASALSCASQTIKLVLV